MRWFLIMTVWALAVPAYAGENDAEKLFRQMEKKVQNAKALLVRFDGTMTSAGMAGTYKGKTVLGEGDRVSIDVDSDVGGKNSKLTVVGTGTKLFVKHDEKSAFDKKDSPKRLGGYLRTALPRVGTIFASGLFLFGDVTTEKQFANVHDVFMASEFKLGAKEKVAGAEAQVVEYAVVLGKEKSAARMWISTRTNLPAKLEVRLIDKDLAMVMSETYTEYALDGKLDAKLFEEPKASPASAAAKEAEKLFRQMETKIQKAKTLQVRFEGTVSIAGGPADTIKGQTALGESDQVYFDADMVMDGMNTKFSVVGTGTKLFVKGAGNPVLDRKDSPKGLGGYIRIALSRVGVFSVLSSVSTVKELADAIDVFKVSDFKLGAKEKVAGADTQVVEYTIIGIEGEPNSSAKMWINTQTNLPAKLEVRSPVFIVVLTETYTEYTLDGKLDAKLFGEPK